MHALPALVAPASVWGDIYKWTDERGNMVVSNVQPADPAAVRDVVVLAKETKPAARAAPAQAPRPSSPASAPAA